MELALCGQCPLVGVDRVGASVVEASTRSQHRPIFPGLIRDAILGSAIASRRLELQRGSTCGLLLHEFRLADYTVPWGDLLNSKSDMKAIGAGTMFRKWRSGVFRRLVTDLLDIPQLANVRSPASVLLDGRLRGCGPSQRFRRAIIIVRGNSA